MRIGTLAVRTARLAVPLYLVSLLLALAPALVGMIGLVSVAADRPWRGDLLGPNWLNLLMELAGEAVFAGGSLGVGVMALAGLLLVPLAALGQVIAYSFLAGGILERLTPGHASQGAFWADCRGWFWPSLRLSLFGGALMAVVGMAVGVGVGVAEAGRWISADVSTLVQAAIQALLLGWLELGRAIMVRQGQRSVIRCLRQAARAFARPLVLVLWLALAMPSTALLLAAVMPPATADGYSLADLVKALVYGQLVAFLGAWTKVIRLAVATQIAARNQPARPSGAVSVVAPPAYQPSDRPS